ncbi:hypothetical protein GCM10010455_01270 [Microbacterium esteraromaticum]|uniref:hypothetical protein n=1 Tax=Microbacterium esteraromaticum TaxID=57043 RepID=UPI0019596B03|nr:hypothetical protein [Microbacterium esteraromaticum]MBM7465844.1 hypothetical protein [Microbacterium esteraromaticum]
MNAHPPADAAASRDLRLQREMNTAITKGRRAVVVSAFGAAFFSSVLAYLAVTLLDPPAVDFGRTLEGLHRDLVGQLADGTQPHDIDPDARIYGFLAVFAAIAIALAVALDATGRRLHALDESRPTGRPFWENEFTAYSAWAQAGAAFRVLTFIELLVLSAVTGLSALVALSLSVGGAGRLPALTAWLLTALLLLEATRGFYVWLVASDLKTVPDAAELQRRVEELRRPALRRRVRRLTTSALLLVSLLVLAVSSWSTVGPAAAGPIIGAVILSAAVWLGSRAIARGAVLEWGATRMTTVAMASILAALFLLFFALTLVAEMAAAMSAGRAASDTPLWWALGAVVGLTTAGIAGVLDAGGVFPRSSSALDWQTSAPLSQPHPQTPRRSVGLLALITFAGGLALADGPSDLGPALIVSATVVTVVSLLHCASGRTRFMLNLGVTTVLAAILAHRLGEADTVHAFLAILLFAVVLIANLASTRTRTTAAFSVLTPVAEGIRRRRLKAWEARLAAVGITAPTPVD